MSSELLNDELRNLYQQVIVDHSKRPRNFRKMEGSTHKMEGYNPLCGDKLFLYLRIKDDRVADASFEGQGCAISTASASMMTESVIGKTISECKSLFRYFHQLLTEGKADESGLGKLIIFAGVHDFPARVKCASLSWHTLHAALDSKVQKDGPVKTE